MVANSSNLIPPAHRTLADQVVRQLRKQIILGDFKPGERLTEIRLAKQVGASRGTVREALRRLEAESLVERASHRGSKVATFEPSDAYEICALHALLEEYCVRQVPLPLGVDVRTRLEHIVDEMALLRLPEEVDRFMDLDYRFHLSIVGAPGQRRVVQSWNGLRSLLSVLVALTLRYIDGVDGKRTAERHRAIVEAVSQPNTDVAAEVITMHYRSLAHQIRCAESRRDDESPDRE